jgi:hypothetical protein
MSALNEPMSDAEREIEASIRRLNAQNRSVDPDVNAQVAAFRDAIASDGQTESEPRKDAAPSQPARQLFIRAKAKLSPAKNSGEPFGSGNRSQWVKIASLIAVVTVSLYVVMPPKPRPSVTAQAPAGSFTLQSSAPDATAKQVTKELTELGMRPRTAIIERRTAVELQVRADQLPMFSNWAAAHGGQAMAPGLHRIFIDPSPSP